MLMLSIHQSGNADSFINQSIEVRDMLSDRAVPDIYFSSNRLMVSLGQRR